MPPQYQAMNDLDMDTDAYENRKKSYQAAHNVLVSMGGTWIDNVTKSGVVYRGRMYINPYGALYSTNTQNYGWKHLSLAASDNELVAANAVAPGAPRKQPRYLLENLPRTETSTT